MPTFVEIWCWAITLYAAGGSVVTAGGLGLAGLAVIKLLIFDLATMSGLTRVLVFIGTGVVLLTLGTLYAKAYGAVRRDTGEKSHDPELDRGPTGRA